jgi:hypothetical protein
MKFPFIPIDHAIADVRAELRRMNQAGEINEEDCINWAIECIREIGGGNYTKEPAILFVKDHYATLPSNLYLIDEVWLCESALFASPVGDNCFATDDGYYRPSLLLFPGDAFTGSKFCSSQNYPAQSLQTPTYIVKHPRQLKCSIRNCILGVKYMVLPGNEKGVRLMQDEINSIKAVKAFIKMMLLQEKFLMGELPQSVYETIKHDYDVFTDQAQAIMKFDDPADDKAKGYKQDHRYDAFNLK